MNHLIFLFLLAEAFTSVNTYPVLRITTDEDIVSVNNSEFEYLDLSRGVLRIKSVNLQDEEIPSGGSTNSVDIFAEGSW